MGWYYVSLNLTSARCLFETGKEKLKCWASKQGHRFGSSGDFSLQSVYL